MSGFKVNSEGYISIPGSEWGDIIILKKAYLEELLTSSSADKIQKNVADISDIMSDAFVEKIRGVVEKHDMRQQEISEIVGVNQPTVSRLIGKRSNGVTPKEDVRSKFKKAFANEKELVLKLNKIRSRKL